MAETRAPINPTDEASRVLAQGLIAGARFVALAFVDPESGHPEVSRIAVAQDGAGMPIGLISDLAQHTKALRTDPRAALLFGEPGVKGDPLTHPRLSLTARAEFVAADAPERLALRTLWLEQQPKSALYADFADFGFVRFRPLGASLNGGFGRAYRLTPADLGY